MFLVRWLWLKRKMIVVGSFIIFSLGILSSLILRVYTAVAAQSQIYTLETVPSRGVAIIFGAGVTVSGRPTAMLADRVKLGANLYQAEKVEVLLLTGDNHIENYNEPEVMRQYALSLGVPDSALVLDYAGFRTYDSCYRAHAIFQVDQAILVTQAFHLDRALLTCNSLGIESLGVAADAMRPTGYARSSMFRSQIREFPSTAVAILDLMSDRKPTYLGDPLPIFADR